MQNAAYGMEQVGNKLANQNIKGYVDRINHQNEEISVINGQLLGDMGNDMANTTNEDVDKYLSNMELIVNGEMGVPSVNVPVAQPQPVKPMLEQPYGANPTHVEQTAQPPFPQQTVPPQYQPQQTVQPPYQHPYQHPYQPYQPPYQPYQQPPYQPQFENYQPTMPPQTINPNIPPPPPQYGGNEDYSDIQERLNNLIK